MNTVVACVLTYLGVTVRSPRLTGGCSLMPPFAFLVFFVPGLRGSFTYLPPCIHQMTSRLSTLCILRLLAFGVEVMGFFGAARKKSCT